MRRILLLSLALAIFVSGGYFTYNVFANSKDQSATPAQTQIATTTQKKVVETNELLPDLVVLPAMDLTVQRQDGVTKILFSTTYYNQGRGPLELKADEKNQGIRADHERNVFQRIYKKDGSFEDLLVGAFDWHQEHLHYHFTDFVEYDLIPVDAQQTEELKGSRIKSTFCIRDISTVALDLPDRKEEAQYKICGKETQGVSVGWGDTYYYNYPAQFLDVSELASGTYRFVQRVNPASRLRENNYENNTSSVMFKLDMEKGTLQVISQSPAETPRIEHVHLEDPFNQ